MKTKLTKQIEQDLCGYSPASFAGVRLDKFRDSHLAFEVPVMSGDMTAGLVDAVRIDEAFIKEETKRCCLIAHNGLQPYYQLEKTSCQAAVENMDYYCEATSCLYNSYCKYQEIGSLITCFEIKVTKADFRSSHGHNFVGNANYYVVPKELYKEIKDEIPDDIGCIVYSENRSFRKTKECTYKSMNKDLENSLLLSVLKKYSKVNLWKISDDENQIKNLSKQLNARVNEINILSLIINALTDKYNLPDELYEKAKEYRYNKRGFREWLDKHGES